jgi:hypothetical protein
MARDDAVDFAQQSGAGDGRGGGVRCFDDDKILSS